MTTTSSILNNGIECDRRTIACPNPHRILANNISSDERDHVANCFHCREQVVRLFEELEPLHQRIFRRARLFLVDWNPILVCIALLAAFGAVGWVTYQSQYISDYRRFQELPGIRLASAIQPPVQTVSLKSPAIELTGPPSLAGMAWPWNRCGLPPEKLNELLGEGKDRKQIDRYLGKISDRLSTEMQRAQIAQQWCDGLNLGSRRMVKMLRKNPDHPWVQLPTHVAQSRRLSAHRSGQPTRIGGEIAYGVRHKEPEDQR